MKPFITILLFTLISAISMAQYSISISDDSITFQKESDRYAFNKKDTNIQWLFDSDSIEVNKLISNFKDKKKRLFILTINGDTVVTGQMTNYMDKSYFSNKAPFSIKKGDTITFEVNNIDNNKTLIFYASFYFINESSTPPSNIDTVTLVLGKGFIKFGDKYGEIKRDSKRYGFLIPDTVSFYVDSILIDKRWRAKDSLFLAIVGHDTISFCRPKNKPYYIGLDSILYLTSNTPVAFQLCNDLQHSKYRKDWFINLDHIKPGQVSWIFILIGCILSFILSPFIIKLVKKTIKKGNTNNNNKPEINKKYFFKSFEKSNIPFEGQRDSIVSLNIIKNDGNNELLSNENDMSLDNSVLTLRTPNYDCLYRLEYKKDDGLKVLYFTIKKDSEPVLGSTQEPNSDSCRDWLANKFDISPDKIDENIQKNKATILYQGCLNLLKKESSDLTYLNLLSEKHTEQNIPAKDRFVALLNDINTTLEQSDSKVDISDKSFEQLYALMSTDQKNDFDQNVFKQIERNNSNESTKEEITTTYLQSGSLSNSVWALVNQLFDSKDNSENRNAYIKKVLAKGNFTIESWNDLVQRFIEPSHSTMLNDLLQKAFGPQNIKRIDSGVWNLIIEYIASETNSRIIDPSRKLKSNWETFTSQIIDECNAPRNDEQIKAFAEKISADIIAQKDQEFKNAKELLEKEHQQYIKTLNDEQQTEIGKIISEHEASIKKLKEVHETEQQKKINDINLVHKNEIEKLNKEHKNKIEQLNNEHLLADQKLKDDFKSKEADIKQKHDELIKCKEAEYQRNIDAKEQINKNLCDTNNKLTSTLSVFYNGYTSLLITAPLSVRDHLIDAFSPNNNALQPVMKDILNDRVSTPSFFMQKINEVFASKIDDIVILKQKVQQLMIDELKLPYPGWIDKLMRLYSYCCVPFVNEQLEKKGLNTANVMRLGASLYDMMLSVGITIDLPVLFHTNYSSDRFEFEALRTIDSLVDGVIDHARPNIVIDLYSVGFSVNGNRMKKTVVSKL